MSEQNNKIVGIDLGTTYSCIAYMDETGRPVVCPSSEGDSTTPSVVRLLPDEEPVAGKTAKETAVIYPDYTIQFVKSRIGKDASFEYGPKDNKVTTTPAEVSAETLKKVVRDASAYANAEIKDVVITVPAYFGVREKEETKHAGELAGLNVVDIVEEPTAAAFYYGAQNSDAEETICIFDLGGGTFDVTAMELDNGNLTVLTTAGDHDLGGKNWDRELISLVKTKFEEETGYDEEYDSDIEQEFTLKCENAKRQLSSAPTASVPLVIDRQHKANIQVTREEFDAATESLLDSAITLTKEVFERVKEKGKEITKILLVGGSTYMPQVAEGLKKEFGDLPIELNEPNEAVAKGACIYNWWKITHIDPEPNPEPGEEPVEPKTAGNATVVETTDNGDGTRTITLEDAKTKEKREITLPAGNFGNVTITTIANKSYGIRANVDNVPKIYNLIKKDTVLPTSKTERFYTQDEGQTSVNLVLFQSESLEEIAELDEGVSIGDSILQGIPKADAGQPVDLTITMDESGFITITGENNGTPLEGKLELTFSEGVGERK